MTRKQVVADITIRVVATVDTVGDEVLQRVAAKREVRRRARSAMAIAHAVFEENDLRSHPEVIEIASVTDE